MHWRPKARAVAQLRQVTFVVGITERGASAIPPATEPRSVHLTLLRAKGQRLLDNDNAVGMLKPLIDGLRDAGWIVDDRPQWMTCTVTQEIDRTQGPAVRVEIEGT